MSDQTTTHAAPTAAETETAAPAHDGFCDELGPIPMFPPRRLDDRGKLIPVSAEERRARSDAAKRLLAVVGGYTDETDAAFDDAMRGMRGENE